MKHLRTPEYRERRRVGGETALILLCVVALASALALPRESGANPNEGAVCTPPLTNTEYERVAFITGLELPLSAEELPDGRFLVIERPGRLKVFDPVTFQLKLAGALDVAIDAEFGLLGMSVDPNFATTGWIYLYYTLPEQMGADEPFVGRLSRFTLVGDSLDLASELVLLEVPQIINFHVAGHLEFGPGRQLFLSTGSDDFAFGPLHQGTDGATPCNFPSDLSDCAVASSSNSNDLRGKLIRVVPRPSPENPADPPYTVPPGNLFADSMTTRPEIYSMGHRNPFRFTIDEATGIAYVAEVGSNFEELNRVDAPGYYGWPIFEGMDSSGGGNVMIPSVPAGFDGDTTLPPAQPAWIFYKTRNVGSTPVETPLPGLLPNRPPGGALMAGPVYHFDGGLTDITRLPETLDDHLFAWDFTRGRIWAVDLATFPASPPVTGFPDGAAIEFLQGLGFAGAGNSSGENGTIDMTLSEDGHLYVLEMWTGTLYRINFLAPGVNRSPVIVASAIPTAGAVPLGVTFEAAGTTDPEGDPLTFEWDFDGDAVTDATGPTPPEHVYTDPGIVQPLLMVSDSEGNLVTRGFEIVVGNDRPEVVIEAPVAGGFFQFGDAVDFEVSASDSEDGSTFGGGISCTDLEVIPALGHDRHGHSAVVQNDCTGSFAPLVDFSHSDDSLLFYSIQASYTDASAPGSAPVTGTDAILIHPKRREAEFAEVAVGTRQIPNTDPWTGGELSVSDVDEGNHLVLCGRNLASMTHVRYRVASGATGGRVELHLDGPSGPLLSRVEVPNTGGFDEWQTVTGELVGVARVRSSQRRRHESCEGPRQVGRPPGSEGPHDLFFVFEGDHCGTQDLFDLNWIEFVGEGIGRDETPPTLAAVTAISAHEIHVAFSEPVTAASAESLLSYAVTGGVGVGSAALQPDGTTVALSTSPLPVGQAIDLSVTGVEDTSGLAIAPATTLGFSWVPGDVADGLMAFWPLSEGAGPDTADVSGNGHLGTLVGGAAWSVGGARGNAVALDGVDDGVTFDGVTLAGDFTVAAWFNLAPGISNADVIVAGPTQNLNFFDGRLRLFAPGDVIVANTPVTPGRWIHGAVSRQGTLMKLYLDGVLDATNVWPGAAPFTLDRLGLGGLGGLEGSLDEVRIYDRELDAEEVARLYENEPDHPVRHYKLDGGAGETAFDSILGEFDAPLLGNPLWVNGINGLALELDGAEQAGQIPEVELSGDFTLAAWVLLSDDVDASDAIISDGSGQDVNFTDARLRLFAGGDVVVATTPTPPNRWVHAAITRTGSTLRLFLDGTEDATGTFAGPVRASLIGRGNSGALEGVIDDVRFYDHAVSEQQLIGISAIPASAPLAHWLLDDGAGIVAADAVRGNDGALVGGPVFVEGRRRGGLAFDGLDDRVDVPLLEADGDFTLSAWVLLDGEGAESDAIVGQGGPGADVSFHGARLRLFDGASEVIVAEDPIATGEWVHVALVRQSGALAIYVDGVQDPAAACYFDSFGFQALGAGDAGFFNGRLDDVRFYARALRRSELNLLVGGLFTGGPPGGPASCNP